MAILIIDNFDSFTFNLYQMLSILARNGNGDDSANSANAKGGLAAFGGGTGNEDQEVIVKRNNEISVDEIKAMRPSGIVLSPGPGHPAVDRDFGVCKEVVKASAEISCPILGVCLGHQGIVQHSGGNVVRAKEPMHGKMSPINLVAKSPLFNGLESGIKVMRYHSLIAERSSLPEDLEVVAELSGPEKTIMAVQDRRGRLHGLQFHPESVGTSVGQKILENYIALCRA